MGTRHNTMLVNEKNVRGVAFLVFLLTLTSQLTLLPFISFFLMIDFITRATIGARFSILAICSRTFVTPLIRFPDKTIMQQPKRFAAAIGFILALSGFSLSILEVEIGARIILAILSFFSFLEFAFRFCAGCKIFSVLVKLNVIQEELCEDCVTPQKE